jgi:parallel beta-helix repeat protein
MPNSRARRGEFSALIIAFTVLGFGTGMLVGRAIAPDKLTSSTRRRAAAQVTRLYACITAAGSIDVGPKGNPIIRSTAPACPAGDQVVNWTVSGPSMPSTTRPATSVPTTTAPSHPACTPMTRGQADIDTAPPGTAFCIAGVYNWTLTPKNGDQFYGGTLDGNHTTQFAFVGAAANVTISQLEVRNYSAANQQGAIAAVGTGWTLDRLNVHDNGSTAGGAGSTGGHGWKILGGRYWNNRQEGIAGGVNSGGEQQGTTVDGTEIDHNNFTDDTYTAANHNCDDEAGGFKWVGSGNTIRNSYVHDNACRGLWADVNANNSTIVNNRIVDNWADGIMVEISGAATVTGNTVTGNGFREFNAGTGSCSWAYGAGIFISTSGHTSTWDGTIDVSGNIVTGNCNSITGANEARTGGVCGTGCQLGYLHVHGNTVTGSSSPKALNAFGAFTTGPALAGRDIIFDATNLLVAVRNCQLVCA